MAAFVCVCAEEAKIKRARRFGLDFTPAMLYNNTANKNVEMSRSWSSAHDWKSCRGHKLLESSNLSISAKKP